MRLEALRPALRACYAAGVAKQRGIGGDVDFSLSIGAGGVVKSLGETVAVGSLPPPVVACMKAKLEGVKLPASAANPPAVLTLTFRCATSAYDGPDVWNAAKGRDPGY